MVRPKKNFIQYYCSKCCGRSLTIKISILIFFLFAVTNFIYFYSTKEEMNYVNIEIKNELITMRVNKLLNKPVNGSLLNWVPDVHSTSDMEGKLRLYRHTNFFLSPFDQKKIEKEFVKLVQKEQKLMEENLIDGTTGCEFPSVDPFDPIQHSIYQKRDQSTLKKLKKSLFLEPTSSIWDFPLATNPAYLNPETHELSFSDWGLQHAKCKFLEVRKIFRHTDFRNDYGKLKYIKKGSSLPIKDVDFVMVKCGDSTTLHVQCVRNKKVPIYPDDQIMPPNVIMIGFDSVSNFLYQREMPKFQQVLKKIEKKKNVKVIEMKRTNILTDGTTYNLNGWLLGVLKRKLYNAKRGKKGSKPVDNWPWIMGEFEKHGYVTGFNEDGDDGAYTLRMNGFEKQPTHHYFRTWSLANKKIKSKKNKWKNQWSHQGIYKFMWCTRYVMNIMKTYHKKVPIFSLSFHDFLHNEVNRLLYIDKYMSILLSKLYHIYEDNDDNNNDNEYDVLDRTYRSLLKEKYEFDFGDNTIFILFGDHGPRFGEARATTLGRIEERNPISLWIIPRSMTNEKSKYYNAIQTMIINGKERLINLRDFHATFIHLLYFNDPPMFDKPYHKSLFNPIDPKRDCKDSELLPEFCLCDVSIDVSPFSFFAQKGVESIIKAMNNELNEYGNEKCEEIILNKIDYVKLQVKLSNKIDTMSGWEKGFRGIKHEANTKAIERTYLVKFSFTTITKYKGIIEAIFIAQHNPIGPKDDYKNVNFQQFIPSHPISISRLDSYGELSCKPPHFLRKFCSCDLNKLDILKDNEDNNEDNEDINEDNEDSDYDEEVLNVNEENINEM